ncbi:MAG: NHL repeat-containing protein [Coriobacteriia bacterium]
MSRHSPTQVARTPGAVRPRTIVIAMLAIAAVVAAAVIASILLDPPPPGRVRLAELSDDSTATVGFAGMFPAEEKPGLSNPIGVTWDGERLFVAESDAGVVRIFDAEGGRLGSIVLAAAYGLPTAYPSVLAIAGERLAIVDNAANRVIVVAAEPAEPAEVAFTLGEDDDAPAQPTAVAYAEGEFYAADAGDGMIKVYDDQGAHVRSLGKALEPALGFVGSIEVADGRLYVADSNAGRVLVLDSATGEQIAVFDDRYALPRVIDQMDKAHFAVLDAFERAAYIVTADGARIDAIDAESVPEGPMSSPRGAVWVDDGARLYVTDGALGRVVVYNVRVQDAE